VKSRAGKPRSNKEIVVRVDTVERYTRLTGVAVPPDDANIDTGRIFPFRFLQQATLGGLSQLSLSRCPLRRA
jgi:hypothetical protein